MTEEEQATLHPNRVAFVSDDELMRIIAAAQRVNPLMFKTYMYVILRDMPVAEYRAFMSDLYNKRKAMSDAADESVAFICDINRWPMLTLPVKKYAEGNGWPALGVIFPFALHIVCERPGGAYGEGEFTRHEYESVEALVADGWEVD